MKLFPLTRMLLAVGFLLTFSISCSDDDDTPDPVETFDIQEKDSKAGKVLTDKDGKTLYFFTKDVAGMSACSGNCLANWPVFSVANPKLGAGLNAADFGTITRAEGGTQVTYKGWPLYYFKNDAAAGDVNGENVGGIWFVARTTYSLMLGNAQLVGNDGKSYKPDYTEGTAETQFLVDDLGRTLYAFANDKKNKNNFTKPDFSNDAVWPVYTAELKDLPSSIDKTLFGVIDVFGKKQLTYKGWPLYYFGLDAMVRGATKGVSVPRPGVWPIVNKDSPNAPD
jgi:predicted lipoprotein with Yx(FWY)xxD motif